MDLSVIINSLRKSTALYFLFLYSSFIFIYEEVILFFTNTSIVDINFNFIKNKIGYLLISILIFSFIVNVMNFIISYLINIICGNRKITKFENDNYIQEDELLIRVLKNQNLVDYQYLQQYKKEEVDLQDLKGSVLCFIFALISNLFFTNSITESVMVHFKKNSIFIFFCLILVVVLFFLVKIIFCDFSDKIYYPKEARD